MSDVAVTKLNNDVLFYHKGIMLGANISWSSQLVGSLKLYVVSAVKSNCG